MPVCYRCICLIRLSLHHVHLVQLVRTKACLNLHHANVVQLVQVLSGTINISYVLFQISTLMPIGWSCKSIMILCIFILRAHALLFLNIHILL